MDTAPLHYCATLSSEANEPLYGSANHKTRWLLLEFSRAWGAHALDDSDLSAAVKAHLKGYLDRSPEANLLFIRQHGRHAEHLAFYIAEVDLAAPKLYAYSLDRYEDLLVMDFDQPDLARLSDELLYLVCTNSRRDACCATYGLPVYRALREAVGEQAWMSTHQGGHRFASTALVMPQGLHYGRLRDSDVPQLVEYSESGQILLEHLRGRVCYEAPVQAGDYLLREQLGLTAIDALRLDSVEQTAPDAWAMRFVNGTQTHDIRLERIETDAEIFTSCSNDKTAFVERYQLLEEV